MAVREVRLRRWVRLVVMGYGSKCRRWVRLVMAVIEARLGRWVRLVVMSNGSKGRKVGKAGSHGSWQ